MGAQVKLLLSATTSGSQGAGLATIGSGPIIAYWLEALKSCTRLLPASSKVFIATSPDTHELYLDWAADRTSSYGAFTPCNILCCDGGSASGGDAPVLELAQALQAIGGLQDGYVVVGSLDYFLGQDVPLRQLVEHTVIRGKDTITYTLLPPGQSLQHVHVSVQLDVTTASQPQPRIAGLDLEPQGEADGVSDLVLAPIMILHPSSLSYVSEAATQMPNHLRGVKQLAWLAQRLMDAGRPVYGQQIDMVLECATAYGAQYAHTYMEFCKAQQEKHEGGAASQALAVVTANAQEAGVVSRGDKAVEQLLIAASPAKQLLLKFDAQAEQLLQTCASTGGLTMASGRQAALPLRFADVTTRRHIPKLPHPLYETTSSEIGRLRPTEMHMPDTYAGNSQAFSSSFAGPVRCRGLVTNITHSKVHKALDDF